MLYIRYETNVPGPSGVGKTHIALALGLAACQKGLGVRFATASYLVHELIVARDEKRLLRLQAQFARVTLLIIDELGYVPLSQTGSELLFDVFSQRYENVVLIVVAKLLAPYRRSAQAGPPGDFEHRHSLRRIQIQSGPACGHAQAWALRTKPWTYECRGCRRQTSVKAGTILHGSKLALTTWFWAAYLDGHPFQRHLGPAAATAARARLL